MVGAVIPKSRMVDDWIDSLILAACRGHDPELWFPQDRGKVDIENRRIAKEICNSCSIKVACLEITLTPAGAIRPEYKYGIYGGLTARQRKALFKKHMKKAEVIINEVLVDAG